MAPSIKRPAVALDRRKFLLTCGLLALSRRTASAASFDTPFGPVDLPSDPRRIVALDTAGAIALNYGVKPVGMTAPDANAMTPAARMLAEHVPLVGQSTFDGQLRYERILVLQPDVIVGMVRGGTDYSALHDRLARIAPTVLLRADGAGTLLDVTFRLAVAMGLGMPAQAERARYEQRCMEIRARWGDVLTTTIFAAISSQDRQIVVYTPNSWAGRVLQDLGARFADFTQNADRNGVFLSYEETGVLRDVGALLYPLVKGRPTPEMADLMQVAGFRDLPSVRVGNMVGITDMWPETHLTALRLLDEIEPFLKTIGESKR